MVECFQSLATGCTRMANQCIVAIQQRFGVLQGLVFGQSAGVLLPLVQLVAHHSYNLRLVMMDLFARIVGHHERMSNDHDVIH